MWGVYIEDQVNFRAKLGNLLNIHLSKILPKVHFSGGSVFFVKEKIVKRKKAYWIIDKNWFLYQKWVFVPKMDMDILCWDGHLFRLNLFPSGSKNFRDVFWWRTFYVEKARNRANVLLNQTSYLRKMHYALWGIWNGEMKIGSRHFWAYF